MVYNARIMKILHFTRFPYYQDLGTGSLSVDSASTNLSQKMTLTLMPIDIRDIVDIILE